jgi:GNAT superfamily N-acetyltransferase
MPDDFLAALDESRRAAWRAQVVRDPDVTVLVCVLGDSTVGFCSFLKCRDDDAPPRTCEISTLYVDPPRWCSGFGAALVERAVALARTRGFLQLSLWVLATNTPARTFYESSGFSADGHSRTHSRLGVPLHEVRYCRQLSSGP